MNLDNAWNQSYKNRDNYVFYPHEEIIRFVSKYIRKRVGFDEFINICENAKTEKILDIGCGIGRHLKMLYEYKLNGYGFDLSEIAIKEAINFLSKYGYDVKNKVTIANILHLPYQDNSFMFALSHGVLDSMPYNVARGGIKELYRVMKRNSLTYFDVMSTEDHTFNGEIERIINEDFEKDTIQSYFNIDRIKELIKGFFEIIEIYQIKKEHLDFREARWHVIVKKY